MSTIKQSAESISSGTDLPSLATPLQVQNFIGVPVNTLAYWRFEGSHLPFVKMGRLIRYRRQDVLDFVESNVFSSTAEARASKEI
ncbi:MAG: hypothetical protein ABF545_00115 [Bifidobacterium psychraerophilum]|uniref:hypothetical protein n=1 Tax=Bifidobacterium psychraerophilum TaxID=218140 RepID=UPI0039EB996F